MAQASTKQGMFSHFLEWHADKALRRRGAPLAPGTLEAKRYRLQAIAHLLGCETPMSLAVVLGDRAQVEALFDKLYLRLAPATILSTGVALKHFGEYAVAQGWIQVCYVTGEDTPNQTPRRKPIEVFTPKEVERILLYARVKDLRFWAFLATLEQTGMRVSEVLHLRWEDVKLDASPPHLSLPKTKTRQALVPLTTMLREEVYTEAHIEKLKTVGHPLWRKDIAVSVFPYQYKSVSAQFRDLCEAAEVDWHNGFHIWRHSFAVRKLTSGTPMHVVSRMLNHSNIATTDRYYAHTNALSFPDWVD